MPAGRGLHATTFVVEGWLLDRTSCVLVQGTLKRDLPSGMSGWDLLGEEEMWDRAISHSTVREAQAS